MELNKDAHWLIICSPHFKADLHISRQKEALTLMNKARFAGETATRLRAIVRLQKSCSLDLEPMGLFKVRMLDGLEIRIIVIQTVGPVVVVVCNLYFGKIT